MTISKSDIDLVAVLMRDGGFMKHTPLTIEKALELSTVFHYMAAMKVLGEEIPKLEEVNELINATLRTK